MFALASFGRRSGAVVRVSFFFRFGGVLRCVVVWCGSRRAAARLLWRFRAARRWWRSSAAPPRSVVGGEQVPRFGLRWLACRGVRVLVAGAGSRWSSLVPAGRFVRRRGLPLVREWLAL